MQNKKIEFRFFLTHFVIVIPVLLASFLLTYFIAREITKQNRQELNQQMEDFAEGFAEMYSAYYDKGVLLANRQELSKEEMTSGSIEAYKGLELLRLSSYFDDSLFGIFVSYQTGRIYSTTGVAREAIYFSSSLGCTEESVIRAKDILQAGENAVTLLPQKTASGCLLFSYALKAREGLSVNFLVTLETMKKICSPQFYNQLYFELEMQDGGSVLFESQPDGTIRILDQKEAQRLRDKKYRMLERILTDPGVRVRLYYGTFSFAANRWLYVVQAVNVLLILAGTVLSGVLSWVFTRRRLQEVADLEKIARGESGVVLSGKNIYSGLQSILSRGWNENQMLEKSVLNHKQKLRSKMAYMVFSGLYPDPEKVDEAFRELGYSKCPEHFFVGLVYADTDFLAVNVPEILTNCLWMSAEYNERQLLLFLCEVNSEDGDRLSRRQIAQTIRSQLHQMDIRKVRVGMSSVFTDSVLINRAYVEAEKVLDEILSGKRKDFFLCWDEIQNQTADIFLEESLLNGFSRAMQEQNYEDAVYCFQKCMKKTCARECSPQNRIYLRYVILQHVIQYLQKKGGTEASIFLTECMHVDAASEKEFTQTITNVLYQCLNRKEDDAFAKMQEFIGAHYQNSELTYEEVAAAGGISRTYISKVFRAKLNMSYIEYLTAVRMDKACMLLRTTDRNISEVAKMVGYANDSSFRRVFKECFGVSASDYRKKEKE